MRIAITGTIGSGKTTVAHILEKMGYRVIYTDGINATLLSDPDYVKTINVHFPDVISDGVIDRKKLSRAVFGSDDNRKLLNSIAHPIIKEKVKQELSDAYGSVFVEVPLLKESGMEELFDEVWLVVADDSEQLRRVALRDGRSDDEIARILASQSKEDTFSLPTIVIHNVGDIESLIKQVRSIL